MKQIAISSLAVRNLELLATRVWLKQAKIGEVPDIPRFIARDRLCSQTEATRSVCGWDALCVPARADIVHVSKAPCVKIELSPGVKSMEVLKSIRESLSFGSLGDFQVSEAEFSKFSKIIDRLLLMNPSIQQAYNEGWLCRGGKTFPALEQLFAREATHSTEILNVMQLIVYSNFDLTVNDNNVTTLTFKPSAKIFVR